MSRSKLATRAALAVVQCTLVTGGIAAGNTAVAATGKFDPGINSKAALENPNCDAANKHITTYFRKSFIAERMTRIARLTLKLVVEDGAIVYLNGTPVVYENLSGDTAYDTLATAMPVALQSTWHAYRIEPGLLVEGANALAVEIHQSSVTGSNISFDLQLLGE